MRQAVCKRFVSILWRRAILAAAIGSLLLLPAFSSAQEQGKKADRRAQRKQAATSRPERTRGEKPAASLEWPPKLPGGVDVVTDSSPELLVKPAHVTLAAGVEIAKAPPTIDLVYYGGQDAPSKLWSVWGDGSTVGDKYYSAIGDHASPKGRAQVYEYDATAKKMRLLVEVTKFLEDSGQLPADMNYTPGKIHSRIDIGPDGWVYFSTHRGSGRTTTDAYGYQGDWVLRTNPATGKTEVVVAHPIPKHCLPGSVLDGQRMIFYGTTQFGQDAPQKGCWFYAYDVKNGKLLTSAPVGFQRYAMLSSSTGCVYWMPRSPNSRGGDSEDEESAGGSGKKYDPKTNQITDCPAVQDVRACTRETADGLIYGVGGRSTQVMMSVFDVKTEKTKVLGPAAVAGAQYITTMDIDPSGRYVYYAAGAHGGGAMDGTPVIQYDTKANKRKVIAFLQEYYSKKYTYVPDGTFGSALSPDGSTLFVTWNGRRVPTAKEWDTVAMTAIHIPASERQP